MPIILIEIFKRRYCAAAIIRGMVFFSILSLIIIPVLVHANEWGCDNVMACLKGLEDKDPYVRRYAAANIRSFGQELKNEERQEIIAALKQHLQDTDNRVRYRAAGSLVDLDNTPKYVLPVLFEMLKDKEEAEVAALNLRHFGAEAREAVPIIIDLMDKEGISWSWGYPHSTYADVLRDIGTPEALAAITPFRRRELVVKVFYSPIGFLMMPPLAILTSICFMGLFLWGRTQYKKGIQITHKPLLITALSWGLYAAHEYMYGGNSPFRLDLMLYWWFLLIITLTGLIPLLISRLRARTQEKCQPVGTNP
ncbi:MAG: HEAT repeat domain-containing protein [Elusimicrobia bacterium]|nr:HEAT repeat domain-containing protein [Elusimicrobiota bacterium]